MNCALNHPDASLPDDPERQIQMKKIAMLLGACSLSLSGCGTAVTVLQDDADAARGLRKQKTYCQSIPRIYSGLAYDFCVLNAPPDPTGFLVPLVLLDLGLSGVLDTVFLPYTIYRQGVDGNIGIYWRAGRG
ncbi:hypothetical protein AM274_25965 [Pseudomonas nunensis]|nr:hypothetical protein AM274_25965 [Pseudomonas nunensis]